MATEVIKTVKPSGGDYTSLAAWEAGEQRNLVTADEIAVAECYAMSDATGVTINGFTTDATRYVKIYTPTSERHDGKWNTSKYRLEVSGAAGITIQDNHVRIEGLQVYAPGAYDVIKTGTSSGAREIHISYNILKGDASGSSRHGIVFTNITAASVAYIYNNIVYDLGGASTAMAGIRNSDADMAMYVYNNTVHSVITGKGIRGVSTSDIVKNNLVSNTGSSCFAGTFGAASDYNASDDGTSTGGSNDRINQTFTFVDEAGDDFHLASNDAGARDHGVTDPGSGLFSDDIDGETRSGSWDIGADEYISGGVTVTPAPATCIAAAVIGAVILGSVAVTPTPASVIASRVNPTVVQGSIAISPDPAGCVATGVDPTVVEGGDITIIPTPAFCVAGRVNPTTVLGSLSVTPPPADCIAASANPVVVLGSVSITPSPAYCIAATVDPTVIEGGGVTIAPSPANCVAAKTDPSIILSSVLITPIPAFCISGKVDPIVALGAIPITPIPASCITGRVNPAIILGSVYVIPNPVSVITDRVNPAVILDSISITPQSAWAIVTSYGPTVLISTGMGKAVGFQVLRRNLSFQVLRRTTNFQVLRRS